jgi:hypothetical protein
MKTTPLLQSLALALASGARAFLSIPGRGRFPLTADPDGMPREADDDGEGSANYAMRCLADGDAVSLSASGVTLEIRF